MAKILCIIHGYPPQQNAGAEYYVKEMNDYLQTRGHEINVMNSTQYRDVINMGSLYDVYITHLDRSQEVTELCQKWGKPCINIIHHNWEISHLRTARPNIYCVYNSEWVKKDRGYPHRSLVVRPPVNPARFKSVEYNSNGSVTLVNCNKDKGALIFREIARACPDLRFLAVKGHHGPQITLTGRNLTQWECQEDIRKVFEQTAILVVPSIYESYGRIGIEAMACGIPVIASDTPGLRESLGDAGIFSSRTFIQGWLQNIRNTQGKLKLYPHGIEESRKEHAASVWKQSMKELSELNDLINEITS